MIGGEIEPLHFLAGVVQAEHVGAGPDADRHDLLLQAEIGQHVHRVGADLDAGADLAQLRRLLVDLDVEAGLGQAAGGRQSAEPRAGDDDLALCHLSKPRVWVVMNCLRG